MCGANYFRRLRSACAAAAISAAAIATPAYADAENMSGEAIIVTPLSFIEVNDLDFGTIIPNPNATGDVVLAPDGTRTASAGITLVGNTHEPASFAGQGTNGQIVEISVGANRIWLTGPGGNTNRMRVRRFTIGSTPTTRLSTNPRNFRIVSSTGIFRFPVGAELRVGRNQPPGVYTGTWQITLNYQ